MTSPEKQPLGEHYQPLSPEHLADPYPFYARARRQEPIFFSPELNAYVVTRFKDIRPILANPTVFSSQNVFHPLKPLYPETVNELSKGYPLTAGAVNSDGEIHALQRDPWQKLLTPARVKLMEPMIQEKAQAIVGSWITEQRIDLMNRFAKPLPIEVICTLVGIEPSDVEEIARESGGFFGMMAAMDEQTQAEAARSLVRVHKLLARYIRERRENSRDDFMSAITSALAPGDGPLTREQEGDIAHRVSGIVFAAYETTSSVIGAGVKVLLEHPDQWYLLHQQPELIAGVVEELIRFVSPGQAFFRLATRDVTIGDENDGTALRLSAGSQVLLLYGSANHDEAACPHADHVNLHRPVKRTQHLGFGYGVHYCVGAHLARTEIEIGLRTLTQRLPQPDAACPESALCIS